MSITTDDRVANVPRFFYILNALMNVYSDVNSYTDFRLSFLIHVLLSFTNGGGYHFGGGKQGGLHSKRWEDRVQGDGQRRRATQRRME